MRVIFIIIIIIIIPAAHVRSWCAMCSAAGALAICALATCARGIAANLGLYGTTCAVHVLCMCCAVMCYAVMCYAVHVHVRVLCCACACACVVLCMCMCMCCACAACVPCACACAMHVLHGISLDTVALKNASVSTNASCS